MSDHHVSQQHNDSCIKTCEEFKTSTRGFLYLCNMLQPSTQSNEHKEHRWSVEKGDGALAGSLSHRYNEDHTGVDVGNRGG